MDSLAARIDWFKAVILPHEAALHARLRRILPRPQEAEDMAAEALMRAYSASDFERITAGRSYLFQIVRNLVIDSARRDRVVSFDLVADLDLLLVDDGVEAGLQARDELRRLQLVVDQLPIQQRRAFLLRRVYDRSVGEIADEMGLSVSTVEKHLAKAIAQVMRTIGDREDWKIAEDRSSSRAPAHRGGGSAVGGKERGRI